MRNLRPKKTNKTGIRGVQYTETGRLHVQVSVHGKMTYLGTFDPLEEAEDAILEARNVEEDCLI